MGLKNILLKRLEEETIYEDAYGLKEVTKVIEEVFKEAEAKQLITPVVSNSSIVLHNCSCDKPDPVEVKMCLGCYGITHQ